MGCSHLGWMVSPSGPTGPTTGRAHMNIRKTIAGVALSGAILLGGTTAAFAETPPPRPTPTAECRAAGKALHELRVLDTRLRRDYARLVHLRNVAAAHHRDDLVKK